MANLIGKQRPARWWLVGVLVAAWLAVYLSANFWFGPSRIWAPWREASGGLVTPTLLVGLASMVILVGVVLVAIGGYRPAELGLELRKLPAAIVYTLVIWMLLQLCAIAICLIAGEAPRPATDLESGRAGYLFGKLLAQLAGNALVEEVLFRGFLFVQLAMFFTRWMPVRPMMCAAAAGILSSIAFAVAHLPHRFGIAGGYADWSAAAMDQGWLVVWGCVYCWMYAKSGNLLFVVGVHALANARTMLVETPGFAEYVAIPQILGAVIVLAWDYLPGVSSGSYRTGIDEGTSR